MRLVRVCICMYVCVCVRGIFPRLPYMPYRASRDQDVHTPVYIHTELARARMRNRPMHARARMCVYVCTRTPRGTGTRVASESTSKPLEVEAVRI